MAPRRYLMCPPTHFTVDYAINPWMDPSRPVDSVVALSQWTALCDAYRSLGHTVEEIEPVPGLPDMVFAANGALVIDGRVYGAQFRYAERAPEAPQYLSWLDKAGFDTYEAKHVNEGEGDMLLTDDFLLAGTPYRTDHAAHAEVQEYFGLPVITLQLVDPRYYHLDTALAALGSTVAYLPEAFSESSRRVLNRLFPDAILASPADAEVFGLNAVYDGTHVVLSKQATGLIEQLMARGFEPVPVDLSELLKAGGGPKCCTLELRMADS
jgi:N-dimethylarginine dimethylaminohydrolase